MAPQLPEIRPPQLPRIEEVLGFPVPRLSAVVRFVAYPMIMGEDLFESVVRSVTGVSPPPGPVKTSISLLEGFETTIQAVAPTLPGFPAPTGATVPYTPPAPGTPQTQAPQQVARPTRIDVEVF